MLVECFKLLFVTVCVELIIFIYQQRSVQEDLQELHPKSLSVKKCQEILNTTTERQLCVDNPKGKGVCYVRTINPFIYN